jgi:hypothetical protein
MSKTAFFNKFLTANPEYVNVKDYNNILKHIIVSKPANQHIKIKFTKYQLMDNKDHFYQAQHSYYVLTKFVNKCKSKYIKQYNCDQDLCGNLLHNPIVLIEHKTAYKFSVNDLQKVVVNALTHQRHLIPEPVEPKNPYTNLPLSKHNLLLLYSRLNKKHHLYTLFYKCNFDVSMFKDNNRRILLEYAIETALAPDSSWNEEFIEDIYYMCDNNNIRVHEDFPKDTLYRVFRPYLKELYKIRYLFYPGKNLSFWLDCFVLYNPYFGMKYIAECTFTSIYGFNIGTFGYDDRHLEFNQIREINATRFVHMARDKELSITLKPIPNVTYYEPEDDNNVYYDSEDSL